MAGYNDIQVGRYNRLIQKLLSMKGPRTLDTIPSELIPVLPLFHGQENRYLEAWDSFFSRQFIGAAVGANSGARLRNPKGSNVIAVVEKVFCFIQAASDFLLLQSVTSDTDLGAPTPGSPRLAERQMPASTSIFSAQTTAPAGAATLFVAPGVSNTPIDVIQTVNQEFVLSPGTAFQIITNGTNLALDV